MTESFGRLLLLCGSVGLVGAAACRIACRITTRPALRVLVAATLGCFAAITQALILGLVGLGENGIVLTMASALIAVTVRWRVAPPPGPTLRTQVAAGLGALGRMEQAVLGAVAGAGATTLAYLLWRPFTPYDGLMYHLGEPAIWLHNGHPGSLVPMNQQTPVQAYPKNFEVLVGWLLGLAHTPVVGPLLMFGLLSLGAAGLICGLALVGVDRRRGALAAAAVLLIPVGIIGLGGPSTDLPTLVWIVVTGALCLGAIEEAALLPVAFVAAGLALGTKATAAPAVAMMILATLFVLRRGLRSDTGRLLAGAGLGGGVGALWYIQNWVVYGAPLYPFYRFPAGPPLPATITFYRTSFIDSPGAALRAGTLHGYFEWLGGGVFLLIGLVVAAVAATRLRGGDRRWLAAAVVAALVELLAWSTGPFTGYPNRPGTLFFPLDGIRYLFPGLPIIALPVVLLTRRSGVTRHLAEAVLAAAVAANVWALRYWRSPYRPPNKYLAAGFVLGAAVACGLVVLRGRHLPHRRWWRAPVAAGSVLAFAAVLTVPATGYMTRAVAVPQPPETTQFAIATVVGWLNRQPAWTGGRQAVGAGPIGDALLGGPTYSHRVFLVSQATSCPSVRGLLATNWLVLGVPTYGTAKYDSFYTFDRSTCLQGVRPAFTGGGYVIYRPPEPARERSA